MSRRRIPGRNIISDVRSGMSNDQLMDKYQLSAKQLDDVLDQILTASRALARKISEDIRQEMIDSQLMKKYQLSREGLSRAFEKLLEAGFIDQKEFDRCLSPTKPETTFVEKRHREQTCSMFSGNRCGSVKSAQHWTGKRYQRNGFGGWWGCRRNQEKTRASQFWETISESSVPSSFGLNVGG